jgi:mono/diheme cytochrome c family protein
LLFLLCLLGAGCRQQMADQPRYNPLAESNFLPDGQAAQPLQPGTIARGHLRSDPAFYEGVETRPVSLAAVAGAPALLPAARAEVDSFPLTLTRELLQRGQERYNIVCANCHDRVGTGNGYIPQRGYLKPPSFHSDRLRAAPVGHFFRVITLGHGGMPALANQITPRDRWAIVAYVRALQRSQNARLSDLDPEERQRLEKEAPR